MKLSIVMIIYNTELHYVRRALESITRSTLRDVEICMVDDGSTKVDYTALAEEFGARLYKQENGGMLAARLCGIEMATGDYLAFVDSDDTVTVNYHQPMLDHAARTDADIVVNDWAFHTERSRYVCRTDSLVAKDITCEGGAVLRAFTAQEGREHSYYVVWNKIYRTSIIKRVREELLAGKYGRERMVYGEDALLNFYAFRDSKKLSNVHTGYYFYRIHAGQSVNVTGLDRLRGHILSMGKVFEQMLEGLEDHPERETLIKNLNEWRALMSRTHYSHAYANKLEELYPLIKEVYGVDKLQRSKWSDSAVYYKVTLLPNNFDEIDEALFSVYTAAQQGKTVTVLYPRRNRYIARCLADWTGKDLQIAYAKQADVVIPKGEIRLRDRIIHQDIVYAVGVLLFKKGSKLRALLKRIM